MGSYSGAGPQVALGVGGLVLADQILHQFGWRFRSSAWRRSLVVALLLVATGFFGSRIWSQVRDDSANRSADILWEREIAAVADESPRLSSSALSSIDLEDPHRVVFVHDSDATDWDYGSGSYWEHVDQTAVGGMFLKAMQLLTGSSTCADAWSELLPSYQPGETIVFRVNFNNASYYYDSDNTLASNVQVINSIIESLLEFGFPLGDISVLETSRYVPHHFVNMLDYPVTVYDHYGHPDSGSLVATFDSTDPSACQMIDYVEFDFDGAGGPCDDGQCDPGDDCAELASTCPDNVCYESTCVSGCGQVEVPAGQQDEGCLAPAACDGQGQCLDPRPDTPENLRRNDTVGGCSNRAPVSSRVRVVTRQPHRIFPLQGR